MQRPRVIVFDLGGVLLDYAPTRRVEAIAAACRTDEEAVQGFLSGPLMRDLDAGLATLDHLAAELSRLADGRIAAEEAARLWLSVFSPNQALWQLLAPLSRDYRLAAFSNNPPFVRQALPKDSPIETVVLSSEIGALKPEPAAFAAAERLLGAPPQEVLFVDDSWRNVTAARARGWSALHYRSPEALLAELRRNVLS